MQELLGKTLNNCRVDKGLTMTEISSPLISPSSISKAEKGHHIPSFDKVIMMLAKLNMDVDEFIFLMNDEYLSARTSTRTDFTKFFRLRNIGG